MRAIASILHRTLVVSFYKRHALFFGLILFFFVAVVRPPQFFFSEAFVGFLLTDPVSLAGVLGLFVVYFLYTLRYLQLVPGEAAHHFLHVLPAVGKRRLIGPVLLTAAGVLAPVLMYLGTMLMHGIVLGRWGGALAGLLALLMLGAATALLHRRLMRPLAPKGRSFQIGWRLPRHTLSQVYLGMLLRRHRNAVFITKLASMGLLLLLLVSETDGPVAYALRGMTFLGSALLHGYLVARFRKTEQLELGWFRNLPYPGWRKLWQFLSVNLLLILPELLLLLLFILREDLTPWFLPHHLLAAGSTWLLCIGITYLPQVRSQDFYVLLHSFVAGIFIGLLFQLPIWLMYGPALLLGVFLILYGVFREN